MILSSQLVYFIVFSVLLTSLCVLATQTSDDCSNKIDQELGPKLSPKASIVHYYSVASRYSTFHAPRPGTVVNVAEENDVVETVKYCIENNLDFLAQAGGHGWATTFNINKKDVLINLRGLNKVTVSNSKDSVTFEGGALMGEILEATYQNHVETPIPSCNCVGMGAILGGGFNHLIGYYGLTSDNLLSVNLATADGELRTITPTLYPDLWWAIRGAGANFGIVTSATMKAYPPINNGVGWSGSLTFAPDKLENLMQTINDFDYPKEAFITIYFVPMPPDFTPTIVASLWYIGSESDAKAALKVIYDIGPTTETSKVVQYNEFNSESDPNCGKGLRRPVYTVGLKKLDPVAFRKVWNEYVALIAQNPGLNGTAMLLETYDPKKFRQFPTSSSAFPHRDFNFVALMGPAYDDPKLDPIVEKFGEKVRELWKEGSGFKDLRVYINYGYGDEGPEAIYGENLALLKKIKKKWDRYGRFSQFFPIPRW